MSKSYLADLPQFGLEYGASSGCPPFTIVRHILKIVAHFWYRVPLFSYHTPTERTKHGCCTYYAKQLKKTTETAHNNDPVCVCVCLSVSLLMFYFYRRVLMNNSIRRLSAQDLEGYDLEVMWVHSQHVCNNVRIIFFAYFIFYYEYRRLDDNLLVVIGDDALSHQRNLSKL